MLNKFQNAIKGRVSNVLGHKSTPVSRNISEGDIGPHLSSTPLGSSYKAREATVSDQKGNIFNKLNQAVGAKYNDAKSKQVKSKVGMTLW